MREKKLKKDKQIKATKLINVLVIRDCNPIKLESFGIFFPFMHISFPSITSMSCL